MAAQSTAPSSPPPKEAGDPGPPVSESLNWEKVVEEEVPTEKVAFSTPQPMREEQVQNAVNFLSHPKVRGSPVVYRRSFLEKKGLTKEEIDEAFHRVPDLSPNPTSAAPTITDQRLKPQVLTQAQIQQPASAPAAALPITSSSGQSGFHLSQAFLLIGLLAASGAGTGVLFKKEVAPRLKTWIRKVVEEGNAKKNEKSKSSVAEEVAEAAKAAAAAALVVSEASQELLNAKNEERKYLNEFLSMIDAQVEEMKSVGKAIRGLETSRIMEKSQKMRSEQMKIYDESESWIGTQLNETMNNPWKTAEFNQSNSRPTFSKQVSDSNKANSYSVKPSSQPVSVEPAMPLHPKSYQEIIEMVQRGERPPNIKEINDMPPNPNQPIPKPVVPPRRKPWELIQQEQPDLGFPRQFRLGSTGMALEDRDDSSTLNAEPWQRKEPAETAEREYQAVEFDGHRDQGGVVMPEAEDTIGPPKSSFHGGSDDREDEVDASFAGSESSLVP